MLATLLRIFAGKVQTLRSPVELIVERSRYVAEVKVVCTSLTFNFEGFEENYHEHRRTSPFQSSLPKVS
jgi:hypothetical protein